VNDGDICEYKGLADDLLMGGVKNLFFIIIFVMGSL
jgi:hypothetical protein